MFQSTIDLFKRKFSVPSKEVVQPKEVEVVSECNESTISLDNSFKFLDKLFHCSLGKELSLGITKDMIGRLEYPYILKDYSINGIYNSITLELERNSDTFVISFTDITDIDTNNSKVWIYSSNGNWRFYHSVSDSEISSLGEDFRSDKLELKSDTDVYMKYYYSNPLKYYVEKFLYDYRKSVNSVIAEYHTTDKFGDDIVLVNVLDTNHNDYKTGSIYAFSEFGNVGLFHYDLKESCLFIVDMLPEKISYGLGSRALEFMEKIALEHGVKKLKGSLSSFDLSSHKDRLIHFYTKNGFTINDTNTRIEKDL